MAIDYLEYYSGHCFGAIGANSECLNDELLGAEIDAEIDDHIESEIFGASKFAKFKRGIRGRQQRLTNLMNKLLAQKRKGKNTLMQIKLLSKKAGTKSTASSKLLRKKLAKKHRLLREIKAEMHKLTKRIMGMWNTSKDNFKKLWKRKHPQSSFNSPSLFISKHGPHKLQF